MASLALHELLQVQTEEADLAQLIDRELAGGFDLDAALTDVGARERPDRPRIKIDIGRVHLWYLVEKTETLYGLIQSRITRWGQIKTLRETAGLLLGGGEVGERLHRGIQARARCRLPHRSGAPKSRPKPMVVPGDEHRVAPRGGDPVRYEQPRHRQQGAGVGGDVEGQALAAASPVGRRGSLTSFSRLYSKVS